MKIPGSLKIQLRQHEEYLLDSFAAEALNGMLASPPIVDRSKVNKAKWAKLAYEWGEAMIKERRKRLRIRK